MILRCDLVAQYEAHKEEIDRAIERILRSGRYTLGENVEAFEAEFAAYVGAKYGIGVNSGTDALMMGLWSFNLQKGDEVITTPFTAIPTYSAIRHVGATAVFVDIDPETFLIDLKQVEQALTPRTKAVVPVHLFGSVVDIYQLREIVGPQIFILEDCAHSHGASIRGRKTGTLGDLGAFSFYPSINLGGYGDGGMVVTNNKDFADIVRLRRTYGMINKDEFIIDGINSRLDELQAAILRVKLRYLDKMNARRRHLAVLYTGLLDRNHVRPQVVPDDVRAVYHVYCVTCGDRRDKLTAYLEEKDIQTNVYYPMPLSLQKGYRQAFHASAKLPAAETVAKQILALPFYPEIPEETLRLVAGCINAFYSQEYPYD